MKIGVFSTFMSHLATPGMIEDCGKRAEDIARDSIWMGEHVALFGKNTFGYPSSKDGRTPLPAGRGCRMSPRRSPFWRLSPASCGSAPTSVGTSRRSRPAATARKIAAPAATRS